MTTTQSVRAHSQRYIDALGWAAELHQHQHQNRKGKPVPSISHLNAVSGLVWEDGGTEDQVQSHASIHQRCGKTVADIVQACTDTDGPTAAEATKPPWIKRKTAYIEKLAYKTAEVWLVTAADQAHYARDMVPDSRSVALLGQSVASILESPALLAEVPAGQSAEEWVAQYLERPDTHPKD